MQIYICSTLEAKDLIKNVPAIERIEIGDVATDQFGKCVNRQYTTNVIASGQFVNHALTQPALESSTSVLVFYGRRLINGEEMVVPTEMANCTIELRILARKYMKLRAEGSFNIESHFNTKNAWF